MGLIGILVVSATFVSAFCAVLWALGTSDFNDGRENVQRRWVKHIAIAALVAAVLAGFLTVVVLTMPGR
jgi:hypothetical protein